MVEGTTTMRTNVASISTASARPSPVSSRVQLSEPTLEASEALD